MSERKSRSAANSSNQDEGAVRHVPVTVSDARCAVFFSHSHFQHTELFSLACFFFLWMVWRWGCALRLARPQANLLVVRCAPIGGSSACPPAFIAHSPATSATEFGRAPAVGRAGGGGGTTRRSGVCWQFSGSRFPVDVVGGGGESVNARRSALAATRLSFATRRRRLSSSSGQRGRRGGRGRQLAGPQATADLLGGDFRAASAELTVTR